MTLAKNTFLSWAWKIILIFAVSLPTFTSLLRPGYFPMHDDLQVVRVYEMSKCIKDGQIPCRWVPDMGYRYGYPQFNYYGPLPYYVMSFFNLSGVDLFSSVKIGFILSLILGNIAMFLFARSLFGDIGGFVSTVLYAYAPFRTSDLFSRGAMGEVWAFVFLPVILLATKKVIDKPSAKSSAFLALALGGLLFTHNISTLIFIPMSIVWAITLLGLKKFSRPSLIHYFVGLPWSIAIAASFFLPVIFEKNVAHTETMVGGYFDYRAHFVTIKQLFLSTMWGYGSSETGPTDDLSFFIGPIILLLSFVTVFVVARNIKRKRDTSLTVSLLIFLSLGLISAFMAHEKSSFIWKMIPPLIYLQFPWRFIVPATFFFCVSGGAAFHYLRPKISIYSALTVVLLTFIFNAAFSYPKTWQEISPTEKLSGYLWDRQMTISIFDYLPTSAATPPSSPPPIIPDAARNKYTITDFIQGTNWQSFNTHVYEDSEITVNLLDYPGWQVYDNDKKITHTHTKTGKINFSLSEGDHKIHIKLTDTPVRLIGNALTIVFGAVAILFLSKRNKNV